MTQKLDKTQLAADYVKTNKRILALNSKIKKNNDELNAQVYKQQQLAKLLKCDDNINYDNKWVLSDQDAHDKYYYYIDHAGAAELDNFFEIHRSCQIKMMFHIINDDHGECMQVKRNFSANLYTNHVKIITEDDLRKDIQDTLSHVFIDINSILTKCKIEMIAK